MPKYDQPLIINYRFGRDSLHWSFLIPGWHILQHDRHDKKGLLFFSTFLVSIAIISFFLLIPFISQLIEFFHLGQYLSQLIKVSDPYALHTLIYGAWYGKVAWIFFLVLFNIYLSYLSFQYIKDNYINSLELDRKVYIFDQTLSGVFLFQIISLLVCLIYGVLYLQPIEREVPLEMVFNQNIEEKVAQERTKKIANKANIDEGQKVTDKDTAGKVTPTEKINDRRLKSNMSAAPSMKTAPQSNPNKPQPEKKPEKQQNKNNKEKIVTAKDGEQPKPEKQVNKAINNSSNSPSQKARYSTPYPKAQPSPIINNKASQAIQPSPTATSSNKINNNSQNASVQANRAVVDYTEYQNYIQNLIHRNWKPADPNTSELVVVYFYIRKNGQLVPNSIKIKSASSNNAERNAIDAILRSAPSFRPLPAGSAEAIQIDFTFRNSR